MAIELTRSTVRNGEVELAVYEGGNPDGPVVLLVHGWPDTHHLWTRVMEALADDFRVVAYDTRGQGESSDPGVDGAFVLAELSGDLLAVADAVSPDEPVHLLAHDWGSVQAWEAVCEPTAQGRIASFVSISGPNLDHMAHWIRRQLSPPTAASVGRLVRQGLASSYISFFVSPLAPPVLARVFSEERWRAFLDRVQGVRPGEEDVAGTLPTDMVSGLRYYRANVGRMRTPRERRTSVPVLLLVPTRDVAIMGFVHDEVARWVERLERHDVPHGHWLPLEAPDLVAEETAAFIRSVAPGSPS